VLLERIGQEEQALFKADGAGVGDPFHDEMPGILDRRERSGVLAR
jgi:hypothetical protein